MPELEFLKLALEKTSDSSGIVIAFILYKGVSELSKIKDKISDIQNIVAQHRAEIGFVKQALAKIPCLQALCIRKDSSDEPATQDSQDGVSAAPNSDRAG